MKTRLIIIVISLLYISCQNIQTKHITGNYYLVTTDSEDDRNLSYRMENGDYIGGVPPMVSAIWYNDEYIIAKQQPTDGDGESIKKRTFFYIIPLNNKISMSPDENYIGPLSRRDLSLQVKKLGIKEKIVFAEI